MTTAGVPIDVLEARLRIPMRKTTAHRLLMLRLH